LETSKNAIPQLKSANFKIVNFATQQKIPFQLEYLVMHTIQNLLMQVIVPVRSTLNVKLVKGKPLPLAAATFGRFVPERKKDFAWENDKIAYKMYGKEFEKSPKEMSYGIDVDWTSIQIFNGKDLLY